MAAISDARATSETEILSQDEIDELLTAINNHDKPKLYRTTIRSRSPLSQDKTDALLTGMDMAPGETSALTEEEINQLLTAITEKSKIVDTLTLIHKEQAEKLSSFLSGYLKSKVFVHVYGVYDEVTLGEYIHRMSTPTHLSIISLLPLKERAVIEINSSAYSSILDVLFRGSGNKKKYNSELTNLEKFVIEKLVAHSFHAICGSWKKAIQFYSKLTITETCPQETVKISPLDKNMLVVSCGCKINEAVGSINIYYPYRLGTIIAKLERKQ